MAKRSRHAVSAGQDANLVRHGRCGMGRPASCLTRGSPVAQRLCWFSTCVCPSRRLGATDDLSLEIRLGQVALVEGINEKLVRAVLEA